MSKRAAFRLFIAFIVAYTVATTYPGVMAGNRIEPLVLGLPFSMAWVVLWVVIGFAVLLALGSAYADEEGGTNGARAGSARSNGGPALARRADERSDPSER